jgi:hypothetical protein
MSDIILQSQERHSAKFLSTPNQTDLMAPDTHMSHVSGLSKEVLYTTAIGSEGYGQFLEFELPYGYLGTVYLESNIGTLSSGNWTTYPGLSLIDEIELRSGSNVLQSFRYGPVIRYLMSHQDSKTVDMLKNVSGGTSHASGKVISPIPCFWTKFANPLSSHMPPLNTHLCSSKLRLRIKVRSASDIADAGATVGSPSISTRLYYENFHPSSELRGVHIDEKDSYLYPGSDFQTRPQSSAIATATSTTLDCSSFFGSLAELVVSHTLVSNVDTAHDLLVDEGDITDVKVQIDGRDYFHIESNPAIEFEQWSQGLTGITATFGDPVIVPFSAYKDTQNYAGSLEMDSVNKLNLIVTHTAGANCYVDVSAVTSTFWSVVSGNFKRHN